MSLCACASELDIPVGAGAGPWLNVQCVGGALVVEDKSSTGGGGGTSCDPVSPANWGDAPLGYYGTVAEAGPVFCSPSGELRTLPYTYASRQRLTAGSDVNPGALQAGGSFSGNAASTIYSNPSPARIMHIFARFDVGMVLTNTGFCTDAILSAVIQSGSYSGTFQVWRGSPAGHGANVAQASGATDAFAVSPTSLNLSGGYAPWLGTISVTPKFDVVTGGMAAGTVALTAALTFLAVAVA